MNHRAAQRGAELVSPESGQRSGRREVVLGVHHLVAKKVECRAVKRIAARLGGDDHLSAGVVAVFGGVHPGQELELADGIDRGPEGRAVDGAVIVRDAVEREVVRDFARPRHVESAAETIG